MRHYKKSFGLAVAIVVVVAAVCFERSRLANCATSSRVSPKRNFVASLVEALNDNDDATAWLNLGARSKFPAEFFVQGTLHLPWTACLFCVGVRVPQIYLCFIRVFLYSSLVHASDRALA